MEQGEWTTAGRVASQLSEKGNETNEVGIGYIRIVQDMYRSATGGITTTWGTAYNFIVRVGMHQSSRPPP